MARVFISYATEDTALASEVHQWLSQTGHGVFLDRDERDGIALGEPWRLRLEERLRWADAVVCLVTSAYLASTWCTAEVAVAQFWGSRLLPLRAEPNLAHPLLSEQILQFSDMAENPKVARAAVVEALRRIDAAGGAGWPDDRSPFPGLRPFDVDWHRVFFGRGEETKHLVERLRSAAGGAALLVVGPSGCGKSSLVRAGLLSVMASEPGWRTVQPILPGADPVGALAWELAAAARRIDLDWTVEHVHDRLKGSGLTGLADELLLKDPAGPQRRLLVVIDQLEELLTQSASAQRDRFAELVRPALNGRVHVVGTSRSEFQDQLLSELGLASLSTSIYPLQPLGRAALRTVIEQPAQLAGIGLDEGLVDRLVEDTDSGDALPLLAFTLAQLAAGVRGGHLSRARYEQLGGVRGALTRQADAALDEAVNAGGRSREKVITELLRLVTVDEHGRPTRSRIPRKGLPRQVVTELDCFVARRLLTTDKHNDIVVIGVAHEAFLSAWDPLDQAIKKNASELRARRTVEQAAAQWHQNKRPRARLWIEGQLTTPLTDIGIRPRVRDLVTVQRGATLSPTAEAFLRASIHRHRLRHHLVTTVPSASAAIALVALVVVFILLGAAKQQRNVAVSRQAAGRALELRAINPALAAQLSLATEQQVHTTEALSSLLSIAADPYATRLTGHTTGLTKVAFSPDGHTLATGSADNTVLLWNISDSHSPRRLGTLTGHIKAIWSLAFSPDGHTLVTGSVDNDVRLWDISNLRQPQPLSTLIGHTAKVFSVVFSPEGRTLATGSVDNTARLWDISDLRQPHHLSTLTGHTNTIRAVAFSPDGHTLATASDDTTARLWDTDIKDVATRICAITWPAITDREWDQYLPDLPHRPPCP